tara:strand:- start:318 stop:797 length:480 start_codon:yes stop_codon:yes gene_type:complete
MKYELKDTWNVWYHSKKNSSWNNQSYKNIIAIENLYDLKYLNDIINLDYLKNGMFFIMRNDIFPTWEHPDNRKGCCISYKIYDNLVINKWNYIVNHIVNDKIDVSNNEINGVSISPKKSYSILKIWFKHNIKSSNLNKCIMIDDPIFDNTKALVKKNMK